jgi:hypothetical protein
VFHESIVRGAIQDPLPPRGVADTVNRHTHYGCNTIENQVRVGIGYDASHIAFAGRSSAEGIIVESLNRRLQLGADALRASRRPLADIG